ncbi:hypothetical protein RJ55_02650 [Drechmeria coniospora]|nr:hypothetical protein RJ55_02650 [Drechmeria coniospora]
MCRDEKESKRPQQRAVGLAGPASGSGAERGTSSGDTRQQASAVPAEPAPAYEEVPTAEAVPTISDPFSFPSSDHLPPYEESGPGGPVIAIPQCIPEPAAPFVNAYPPVLLGRGITDASWRSFVETVSAFLAASVSDRAISYAGDVAKHLGEPPKSFSKGIAERAKSVGKGITGNAKRGNVIGAAGGILGGLVYLPIAVGVGAISTVARLPSAAVGAVAKKPQTPLERASAYATVANRKWLRARGLQASLVDTEGLSRLVDIPSKNVLELATSSKKETASAQLAALEGYVASLQVSELETLRLAPSSLWLVLVPVEQE